MTDLITWLRAQLDEDERVARRAGWDFPAWSYDRETFTVSSGAGPIAGHGQIGSPLNDVDGEHIARHDPARVLADVQAKRRILDEHAVSTKAETGWTGEVVGKRTWGETGRVLYSCRICDFGGRHEDAEYHSKPGCLTVRLLALPYADRLGYLEEWRP
jgi:hypothetical protein